MRLSEVIKLLPCSTQLRDRNGNIISERYPVEEILAISDFPVLRVDCWTAPVVYIDGIYTPKGTKPVVEYKPRPGENDVFPFLKLFSCIPDCDKLVAED